MYQGLPSFANVNIFFQKNSIFGKNGTFTQSNSQGAVLEVF